MLWAKGQLKWKGTPTYVCGTLEARKDDCYGWTVYDKAKPHAYPTPGYKAVAYGRTLADAKRNAEAACA